MPQQTSLRADPALKIGASKALQSMFGDVHRASKGLSSWNTNNTSVQYQTYGADYSLLPAKPGDGSTSVDVELLGMVRGGEYPKINFDATPATATLRDYGLEGEVPDRQRDLAMENFGQDLAQDTAFATTDWCTSARDARAASLLYTAANWQTAAASAVWDGTSENIQLDVITGGQAIQKLSGIPRKMLTLQMGQDQWDALRDADNFLDKVKFSDRIASDSGIDEALRRALINYLGVKDVINWESVFRTSREGQTVTGGYTWSTDNSWLGFIGPDNSSNTAAALFKYTKEDLTLWRGRNQKDEFETIRCKDTSLPKVVQSNWGYVISNTLT